MAKIVRTYAGLPIIGQIAAAVEIAALFITMATTIGRISAFPKYHDGDEVTLDTARSRLISGGKKPDEVDARLQVGEGVIQKDSYQPNKKLLSRLNKLGRGLRSSDLADLLDGTGVVLPESVMQGDTLLINQLNEQRAIGPDRELHRRVDDMHSTMQELLQETRKGNKSSKEQLPDGRYRITDENGNVRIVKYT